MFVALDSLPRTDGVEFADQTAYLGVETAQRTFPWRTTCTKTTFRTGWIWGLLWPLIAKPWG